MDIFNSWIVDKYIAHRGLHSQTVAENSLTAFRAAVEKNYAIELDVQLIADKTIVVFHDESLARVTNQDGYLKNLIKKDLKKCNLQDTTDTIPTLEEVLKIVAGKVPLLIEIKNLDKVGALESALMEILNKYTGEYAIQSFNPLVLLWFKEHYPNVLRGQLSSCFKKEKLSGIKRFALKRMILNKRTQPHFISYKSSDLPNRYVRKYNKLPLLAWTVRSQEEYLNVVKFCDNVIFEGFEPTI